MKSLQKVIITAGIGLVLGGTLGILFAPRKGKATRKKIRRDFTRRVDNISDKIEDLKEKMEEKIDSFNIKKL